MPSQNKTVSHYFSAICLYNLMNPQIFHLTPGQRFRILEERDASRFGSRGAKEKTPGARHAPGVSDWSG
ncbi:MAG TPA: hypothetical protein VF756_25925 [Thermoanaerobaculia bacterium]